MGTKDGDLGSGQEMDKCVFSVGVGWRMLEQHIWKERGRNLVVCHILAFKVIS